MTNQTKVSIKDIAKLSGVSVSTVSRVINNNGRFSEQTRKKVLKVINQYHYQTNTAAKTLRMNKSNTIGILVPDLSNSFFADLVENIEKILFQNNYATVICDTNKNIQRENTYLQMLEAKLVDGIVMISGQQLDNDIHMNISTPVVYIDRNENTKNIYVGSNNEQGAHLATKHLIQAGTIPVMFTSSNQKISSNNDRIKGYREEMLKNNFDHSQQIVIDIKTERQKIKQRGIEIRSILRNLMSKQKLPLGIFAISDTIAAEVILAAHELNLNIPQDLKVIGFDDAPIARYCYPQLTTIKQNTAAIAQNASNYLLQLIQGKLDNSDITKIVDVQLIERGTV